MDRTDRVYDYISRRGPITRRELGRQLSNIPRAELDAILEYGVQEGDLSSDRRWLNPNGGQPSTVYRLRQSDERAAKWRRRGTWGLVGAGAGAVFAALQHARKQV